MKRFFIICFSCCLLQLFTRLPCQAQAPGYGPFLFAPQELDIYIENTRTQLWDQTIVGFNPLSTDSFNAKYDANKLLGAAGRETLYTMNSGQKMSINILNSIISNPVVDMGLVPGTTDTFIFYFEVDSTFDNTSFIMLQDSQAHVWYNVRGGQYQFTATQSENRSRFVLYFTPPAVINTTNSSCGAIGNINVTQPGPVNWSYVLQDSAGTRISTGALNQNSPLNANVGPGTYTLTLTDSSGYTVVKTIPVGGQPAAISAFSASATTILVNEQVSFSSSSQNAQTLVWDFGDGDTLANVVNPVHVYTAPGVYDVVFTASAGAACSSTSSQSITVNPVTTGIADASTGNLNIWSHSGTIYINFAQTASVDATIKIYDLLGRELSHEKFAGSLYQKELPAVNDAYVIVSVNTGDKVSSRKLLIAR